jgi:co-chaperonin GroES (HSP10)
MAFAEMAFDINPREEIAAALGNIEGVEIFANQVLAAIYIRPEKTKSGIFLTQQTLGEDRYQGKVGLIVKQGPQAFVNDANWTFANNIGVGDWIIMRPTDGWAITVNGVLCRVLSDTSVRGRISSPDQVW